MKIGPHDTDRRVLVVAEVGNNHEGDLALAKRLVRLAAEAGADAVKFQTYRTDRFVGSGDPARVARMKRFEIPPEGFAELAALARETGITFFSTPLDLESLAFLAPLMPVVKVASSDNTFFPFLEAAARTGLPIILSTGLADLATLRHATGVIESTWRNQGWPGELALLHCVTAYPVPPAQANLRAIETLRRELPFTVGYSDHTLGIEAPVLSVALGARIVEKHFTLSKTHSDFRDHQLSADPAEFAELVRRVRATEELLGDGRKVPQPSELANEAAVRRAIAAGRDLPAGHVVGPLDLVWLRPSGAFAPGRELAVLGRRLAAPVQKGQAFRPESFVPDGQA